jgi:hypothetical protein
MHDGLLFEGDFGALSGEGLSGDDEGDVFDGEVVGGSCESVEIFAEDGGGGVQDLAVLLAVADVDLDLIARHG